MKKEVILRKVGEISETEINKLKAEHKEIYTINVQFEEPETNEVIELIGYLKRPERYVMGMALAIINSNPVKAKEIILTKSWLAGDDRIKTDDDAFYSATVAVDELLTVRQASLKKN